MDIKDSLENALSEIDLVREKMSELSKRKDIHQIELDLLLQKLRELYDFLRSLEKIAAIPEQTSPGMNKSVKNVRKTEKVKQAEPIIELGEVVNNETIEKQERTNQKPVESKKSVHELLSETVHKKQSHIGTAVHSKPISNLEDAISVNDKFLFIRELFGSNAIRYKETIDVLNNSADFNSAYNYVEKNFAWESENEAAQRLLELVRRRHISHKNG
jgi:uncharacterized protein (DUF2132 family)